jgi:hypothetical protein
VFYGIHLDRLTFRGLEGCHLATVVSEVLLGEPRPIGDDLRLPVTGLDDGGGAPCRIGAASRYG